MSDEEPTIVVPFIVTKSGGGEFDDRAFSAGVNMGMLFARLEIAAAVGADLRHHPVRDDMLAQADLIAMHHGYTTRAIASVNQHANEWVLVEFTRPTPGDVG